MEPGPGRLFVVQARHLHDRHVGVQRRLAVGPEKDAAVEAPVVVDLDMEGLFHVR